MKRPYFQKITGVNSDLIMLNSFFELAEYDGTYWFIKDIGNDPYVASVEGLTGSTVTAGANRTYDLTGYIYQTSVARAWGNNIYLAACYLNSGLGFVVFIRFYSLDGGNTWQAPYYSALSQTSARVVDLFKIGSDVFFAYTSAGASSTFMGFRKIDGTGGHGTTVGTPGYSDHFVCGYVYESKYYYLIHNTAVNATYLALYSFDGSNTPTYIGSSGIPIASIDTWDIKSQIYFLRKNTKIFMNPTSLRSQFKDGSWVSYFVTIGTSVNGVIKSKDHLGNRIFSHNLWGNAIWEITDKGVLKKIQALEPRDYKKVYLTNVNESLAGVVQFQDANGNDDLRAWINNGLDTFEVIAEKTGHQNILHCVSVDGIGDEAHLPITSDNDTFEFWIWMGTTNKRLDIQFCNATIGNALWQLKFNTDGNIDLEGTAQDNDLVAYTANTAVHCKVEFVKNSTLKLWINGVLLSTLTCTNFSGLNLFFQPVTAGVEWWFDSLGILSNSYVSGSNKKINAYVGYGSEIGEAWFSTGDADTSIMQLSFLDYTKGTKKSLVVSEMYQAPKHTLIRRTKPFEDEWVKEYTNAEVLFYEGKVKDNDNDGRFFYKYLMNSWEDEYETTKITVSLSAYTHGAMLKYILDNYSKYLWYGPGTNANVNEFTADQISGSDSGWTNVDGTGCLSSYVAKKVFLNGFLYHVLQQLDNGVGACIVDYEDTGNLVYSGWFASNDVTIRSRIEFYESTNRIGYLETGSSKIQWYDGALQDLLDPAVNDTLYHWALVFSETADTVDCYINGIFIATHNLAIAITTAITKIRFTTIAASVGPTGYHSNLYIGNSLVDAMHTYCSISPLLTDAYDFNFKTYTHPAIQKLIAEETGYIVSVRPSGQVYLDQYAPSGVLINKDAPQGITYLTLMKIRNEKFSQITFYGGYVGGKPIIAEGFAEPNFGSYEDWFPTIDGSEVGDLYYDADGNPKSLRLDAMVAKALSDRNIVIKKQTLGKRGVGPIYHGTSLTYNNNHYKITMEPWNVWRKVIYNALRDDNRVEIADSYLSPTTADPEDDRDSQVDAAIGSNAENIVKVEQNVGAVEEKTTWTPRDYGIPDFDDDGAEGTPLTDDVAWNDLDISAIVGAKTMRVIIHVLGLDNVINSAVFIRTKGHTGAGCRCVIRTGSAGQEATNEWEGHTNSVGVLQIQCMPKPTSWNQISLWIADYRRA